MSTRFAKIEDAHVAYRTWGDGPLDLLFFEEIPVDMLDDEPRLAAGLSRLSSIGRVIAFDPRGLGLSDRLEHPGARRRRTSDRPMRSPSSTRSEAMQPRCSDSPSWRIPRSTSPCDVPTARLVQ